MEKIWIMKGKPYYTIVLREFLEEGIAIWRAECVEMRGNIAQAATPAEALENLGDAIELAFDEQEERESNG